MSELGVFPTFLENDLLKVNKILGLTFFKARKDLKGFKMAFFIYCSCVLCKMDCLQLPFICVEEAVLWTQRFLTRKFGPKIEVYLWQTNLKANVCKNSMFQVNRKKNGTGRRLTWVLPRATEPPFLSALYAKNDTTNLFGYKLGGSTENNKALLFFSGKETIQTFNSSI